MRHGFTLIELVVALAVAAILAAVAVPALVLAQGPSAAAVGAQRLALVLRSAQARACAGGCAVDVVVDRRDGSYEVRVPAEGDDGCVAERGSLAPASVDSNYPGDTVRFAETGFPCGVSGSARAGTFAVTCGGSTRTVVLQLAGRIRCG